MFKTMTDLTQYQGTSQFGKAYHVMYQNDSHAPGSVDRALLEEMVRICPETRQHLYTAFTPLETRYTKGSRPALEQLLPPNATAAGIARLTGETAERCPPGLDGFLLGGTEGADGGVPSIPPTGLSMMKVGRNAWTGQTRASSGPPPWSTTP